jgi:putative hydrolase of the HAD superfamily
MTPVQAVFFDLDGTLIDDETAARRCAQETARHFAASVAGLDAELLAETFSSAGKLYWAHRVATGIDDLQGYRVLLWQQALRDCGVEKPGLAEDLASVYGLLRAKAAVAFDDALPVVEALVGHGYRLAVITNGPSEIQRYKLELVGLDRFFDAFVASTDVGAGKPDRIVFETALRALGAEPEHTWHIGDNLATDVAGAINAGLSAAWLNREAEPHPGEHPQPHAELRTLRELPSILPRDSKR